MNAKTSLKSMQQLSLRIVHQFVYILPPFEFVTHIEIINIDFVLVLDDLDVLLIIQLSIKISANISSSFMSIEKSYSITNTFYVSKERQNSVNEWGCSLVLRRIRHHFINAFN